MANTITVADDGEQSVKSDEARYAEYDAAISAVSGTGQAYMLFGSRQVTHANLEYLEKMRLFYENRILRKKGATSRNLPDFSSGPDSNNIPSD